MKKRIGLTLGGGGVRGLAHVPVLETLDELDCRPSVISGTSMGAIIGAMYASGMSGKTIRERIRKHTVSKNDTWPEVLKKKAELLKWVDAFALEFGRGGLLKTDKFLSYLLSEIGENTFEKLNIPLLVVATDFWGGEEVVIEKGELLPAIKASMAVPGVFGPVSIGDKVLVDGGVVNLVPYDHIIDRCDVSIVVNVAKARTPGKLEPPTVLESILGTFEIMQMAALAERMKRREPDIYIRPEISDVRMFDFNKIEDVFRQTQPAIEELRMLIRKKILEDE
ncbi:MAG: patatin-like phospholipase family protein [Deltaproteobacteria bacterium]|nr:patatin-like phospholipase family protein [Deltaproteobacteria bacterium]